MLPQTALGFATAAALMLLLGTVNVHNTKMPVAPPQAQTPFVVYANGKPLPYNIYFKPLMPGDSLELTSPNVSVGDLSVTVSEAPLQFSGNDIRWKAPQQAGLYPIVVRRLSDHQQQLLNVFVMVPAKNAKDGKLNGFRIGKYPPPYQGRTTYKAPRGFIEVTPSNQNTQLSPNFTLGQFLCKQEGTYPKYLVLQPRLLDKLEALLADVNSHGFDLPTFTVMSGYRTPFYNKAIKNVPHSFHIYGGAADIYVDIAPQDGVMDDLNGDGKIDRQDAAWLYRLADTFVTRKRRQDLMGGVGEYDANHVHGPFVHVDVRGVRARWGH